MSASVRYGHVCVCVRVCVRACVFLTQSLPPSLPALPVCLPLPLCLDLSVHGHTCMYSCHHMYACIMNVYDGAQDVCIVHIDTRRCTHTPRMCTQQYVGR